jgi:hypothetical protein
MRISQLSPIGIICVWLRGAIDALREARWITRRLLLLAGYLFALLSVYLLVSEYRFFTTNGLAAPTGQPLAYDFLNYFAGAKAAVSGHARDIYDNQWFRSFESMIVGPKAHTAIYSYPPVMMLLSLPLERLVGWRAAGLALVGAPAAFYNLTFARTAILPPPCWAAV